MQAVVISSDESEDEKSSDPRSDEESDEGPAGGKGKGRPAAKRARGAGGQAVATQKRGGCLQGEGSGN